MVLNDVPLASPCSRGARGDGSTHEARCLDRGRVVGQGLWREAAHDGHGLAADALLHEVAEVRDGVVLVELLCLLRTIVEADLNLGLGLRIVDRNGARIGLHVRGGGRGGGAAEAVALARELRVGRGRGRSLLVVLSVLVVEGHVHRLITALELGWATALRHLVHELLVQGVRARAERTVADLEAVSVHCHGDVVRWQRA
mmetsp:Transcript_7472/g.27436  ORF Transcript_7472/g.27436 Transcript_7472/m.27436 type:complete len:200 (-) Transcript_7472:227-826(-)